MFRLIGGLPDAITLMCLAYVPYHLYPKLELVSRSWKATLRSVELFRLRREFGLCEEFLAVCCRLERIWQLYDPVHKLWMALTKFPPKTRRVHFGVVSTSQKMFVIGGQIGFEAVDITTNEVWAFDLVARTWSMLAPMLMPRAFFACCIVDEKIVVAGGFTTNRFEFTAKAEMYDIEKDVWTPLPDLLWVRDRYCKGLMIGGKMYIDCDSSAQVFDNLELKWRVSDYKWLSGEKAVVRDVLYAKVLIPEKGYAIMKHDGRDSRVVSSPRNFPGIARHMIGFRGELYMIGGQGEAHPTDLSDVLVLNVGAENPTWHYATPMSRQCNGLVHGCTELRI